MKGRLGPWNVGRVLGMGEGSSVHLCTHADDPERVAAVKILGRRGSAELARFRQEAEILASLSHPNIVKVYGLDLEEELPYLEMEHIAGQAVSERLLDGPLPLAEALDVVRQLLDALAYLHARNVAHRDVRPSNLLLHGGRVVLVDFGLARQSLEPSQMSLTGARFGAAEYAPPEWIGPKGVDGMVWDMYAVGVVLQELITGQRPFPTPDTTAEHLRAARIMTAKREVPHLDPGPTYPEDLRALIRDLTLRDASHRLKSASAAAERLRALAPVTAEPEPPPEPREPLSESFRITSGAWTGVMALAGLGSLALVGVIVARLFGWL